MPILFEKSRKKQKTDFVKKSHVLREGVLPYIEEYVLKMQLQTEGYNFVVEKNIYAKRMNIV